MSCIVLIGGIPGAGKTEFTNFFNKHASDLYDILQKQCHDSQTKHCNDCFPKSKIHIIAFDELCSIEDQAQISKTINGWRNVRLQILEASERYICSASNIDCLMQGPLSYRCTELIQVLEERNDFKLGETGTPSNIFLVEDNFYYRSMRYEWFQVARRGNIGFCEIFMSCPLNIALQRNEGRNCSIPERLIKLMFSCLELPDPIKNKWEKFFLLFDSKEELEQLKMLDCLILIHNAINEPAEMVISKDKIIAQNICSKNVMHQVDKTLRKLIGKVIKDMKEHKSSQLLFHQISEIVAIRPIILSELREQKLTLPNDLIESIEHLGTKSETVSNGLEVVLQEIVRHKLETLHLNNVSSNSDEICSI